MRIVLFSDIHGNQYAMDAFLNELPQIRYEKIVFCGDVFGYYYGQKTVLDSLRHIPDFIWLKGNHDAYAVEIFRGRKNAGEFIRNYGHSYADLPENISEEEINSLEELPEMYELEDEGVRIGFFHGTPEDPLDGRLYPDQLPEHMENYQKYDIVVMGHTHCRMAKHWNDKLLINSGSLGQPRDGNGYGYAILDTKERVVSFHNVQIDQKKLYAEIDLRDPQLTKLKEVLERKAK